MTVRDALNVAMEEVSFCSVALGRAGADKRSGGGDEPEPLAAAAFAFLSWLADCALPGFPLADCASCYICAGDDPGRDRLYHW